jgi:hypothetical protein
LTAVIGAVTALLTGSAAAAASDETRLVIGFRPAQPQRPVTVDITNAGTHHAVPSLSVSGSRSGIQLAGYNRPLPLFSVRGLSLAPRYGDHRLAFDFQPSALTGMALSPRSVRGLTIGASGKRGVGTVLIGQLVSGPSRNGYGSAVPRVLAFSAAMRPQRGVVISPRLVMPLARRAAPDAADPTIGVGMRAELSRKISVIGDVGNTRTWNHIWAPSAVAGTVGHWSRVSFEATASHGGTGAALLGSVPYAALTRTVASARVVVMKGISVDGLVGASNPAGRPSDRTVQRAGAVRVERFPYGNLLLQFDRSRMHGRTPHSFTVEWRHQRGRRIVVQLHQRSDGSRASSGKIRQLQIEVPSVPGISPRLSLDLRSSVLLSDPRPGASRTATSIRSRVAAGAHLAFTGEANLQILGTTPRPVSRVVTGAEIPLGRAMALTIGYVCVATDRAPRWKRLEANFTRSLR